MIEYRTISFMQPASFILGNEPGAVSSKTIGFDGSAPELAEHMDGWEVINGQIVPAGENVYVVYFLRTKVEVNDFTTSELGATNAKS